MITNTDEVTSDFEIEVYPNPFNASLIVNANALPADSKVVIYNLLGQVVYQQDMLEGASQLNVGHAFTSGVYMLSIQHEGKIVYKKRLIKE